MRRGWEGARLNEEIGTFEMEVCIAIPDGGERGD
jgi:hypothetical protein